MLLLIFWSIALLQSLRNLKDGLKKAGYLCEICEITQMKYQDHILYSPSGHPVDLIYRRAVTTDVMEHYSEVQDFVQAVLHQDVCVIGSFCTQIIHNKWLFKILREKATLSLLTKEEQQFVLDHIPLYESDGQPFLPPESDYPGKGPLDHQTIGFLRFPRCFAGIDYTQSEWDEIVERHFNKGYIYQEYCPPYQTANIYFPDADAAFKPYTNMSGLFVYNGESQAFIPGYQTAESSPPSTMKRRWPLWF